MGDIRLLLHDAVPVDEIEPDLAAVAGRVRRRRQRRVGGRVAAMMAAVAVVGGVTVVSDLLDRGRDPDRDRDGTGDVATGTDPDGDGGTRSGAPTGEASDAAQFARLLAERSWLQLADPEWPVQPSDFVDGTPEEGIIVVGTLGEVRAGPVVAPRCRAGVECAAQTNVETVLHVDLVLPGDQAHPDELVVPWATGQTGADADQAVSDRRAAPFTEAAPIGARVLVFLRPGSDGHYQWRPVEPSGIVIEDADGIAIPQADPDAPRPDWTFDDYLAEVDRLLTDQQFPGLQPD